MKIRKRNILIYYRIFICIFSLIVINKLTTLGDYERYINGNPMTILNEYGYNFIFNGTVSTEFLVGVVRQLCLGNSIVTSIIFNFLGSLGIVYFLKSVHWNKIIYLLILFPSFSIWSSYPSKELMTVLATGFVMGNLVKIYEEKKKSKIDKILLLLGLFILYVYKKQYLICILFLIIYTNLRKKIKFNFRTITYWVYLISIIMTLYLLREKIDTFFRTFHLHFDYGSEGTVRNIFIFREKYGFYKNMLYGMFISFFGPSLFEVKQGGLKLLSFLESSIIIGVVLYSIIKMKTKNIERLFLFFNGIFLLLLPQYPFGIFNSGSAIRYRTNLYIIFLGVFYIFILKRFNLKKYYSRKIRDK